MTAEPYLMQPIETIAVSLFDGATCQKDLDARLGDFIVQCAENGVTATPGKLYWVDEDPHVLLTGWRFEFSDEWQRTCLPPGWTIGS